MLQDGISYTRKKLVYSDEIEVDPTPLTKHGCPLVVVNGLGSFIFIIFGLSFSWSESK